MVIQTPGLVLHLGRNPDALWDHGPAGSVAVKISYCPLVPIAWNMVRYGCEADGGSTVNQYVGGRPSMERGTYESGFLRAVRFAAIVVVYTLPGEQHVVENNVTLLPVNTGDPKKFDVDSGVADFDGRKTS